MKLAQVNAVFNALQAQTTEGPPYKVGVLMVDGQRFVGWAHPASPSGLVKMDVDRTHLAHLTKPPLTIWLDIDHMQAMTDDGFVPVGSPATTVTTEEVSGPTVAKEADA